MRVKEESSLPKRKNTKRFLCSLCAIVWPWLNDRNPVTITVSTMPEIIINIAMATITSSKVKALLLITIALPFLLPYPALPVHSHSQALSVALSQVQSSPNQIRVPLSISHLSYNGIQIIPD